MRLTAKSRVLIIDDDPTLRILLRRALEGAKFQVDEAAGAQEALDLARKEKHDAIVLDFVLPDADGLALLEAFATWGVQAPVIALSGSDNPEVALRFVRSGVTEFLHKDRLTSVRIVHSVRHAIRVHKARAELTRGAFRVTGAARASPEDEQTSDLRAATGTALVVDDTSDARLVTRRILEHAGWSVREAARGDEALRALAEGGIDVVLLDHILPDMSGTQVLREMRARDVATPVVALTGHGDERVAQEFIMAGASDFLGKDDLSEARLLLTLRNAMWLAAAPPATGPS